MKTRVCRSGIGRARQVRVEFTDKPITAWGGLAAIMSRYLDRVAFRGWVETHVPIEERSNNGRGIYEKVLATFLTVLSGGTRFSHLGWWSHGTEVLKECFGVSWLPLAATTLTRFWGKIDRQSLSERLLGSCRQFAAEILAWDGVTEDTLNLDSSVLTRYGQQEGANKGYNPKKKGRPSHHPLLGFVGSGYVVNFWNRSGDTGTGQGAVGFFAQTLQTLGSSFRVRWVLCDSGFYLIELIEFLEQKLLKYVIAVRISQTLQREIMKIVSWEQVDEGLQAAEFEFEHDDPKWTHPRRYVVVRQELATRPTAVGKQPSLFEDLEELKDWRYSLLLTNDRELPAVDIWRTYRPRANDENVIKDLKEGYGLEAFNTRGFWATEAILGLISLVFHNLLHYLNRRVLNPQAASQQLRTIRLEHFVIPALLGSGSRCSVLRMGVKKGPKRAQIRAILQRISLIPCRLKCIAFA